jgi:hypothetical protein
MNILQPTTPKRIIVPPTAHAGHPLLGAIVTLIIVQTTKKIAQAETEEMD